MLVSLSDTKDRQQGYLIGMVEIPQSRTMLISDERTTLLNFTMNTEFPGRDEFLHQDKQ